MKIGIEKKNFTQIDLSPWKARCGAALDRLWETGWVRLSICGEDRKNLDVLTEEAERICGCSDVVVVLACGSLNRMISAVTEAAPCDTARPQVIVFGDNLSARDYARLLDRLDRRDFSLIVAAEEESLPLRCAYACLKQLLVGRYGSEQASRRILALGGARSEFLAEEAAENDFPMLICSDIASTFGAGTEFALLPLALMGINLKTYLEGFYDMLASPAWDADGADYAAARAAWLDRGEREQLLYWQSQLSGLAKWQGGGLLMPAEEARRDEKAFETVLLVEQEEEDIMTPFFPGCSQEGSLNQLLLQQAKAQFAQTEERENFAPGVKLTVENLNSYHLGQLFAFIQLSRGITEELLRLQ